jgi:bacteriorhodopsin
MWIWIVLAVIGLFALLFLWLARQIENAPEGYEDDELGFCTGKRPGTGGR